MSTINDIALMMTLTGKSRDEVESQLNYDDMFREKCKLHNKAFEYQRKIVDISQEEANGLNKQLRTIVRYLEENGHYDEMEDYMVNFDSFVPTNSYYRRFSY